MPRPQRDESLYFSAENHEMNSGVGMLRQCDIGGEQFRLSEQEIEYCERNLIPLRSSCATERLRQILLFRSSPHLYHAVCAISGERVVTVVPPASGYRVYDSSLEAELNAEQYARPYDFTRGFFEQFEELARAVPYFSRVGIPASSENCDFCQGTIWSKNCYLCFRAVKAEDCLFSRYVRTVKDLVDCVWAIESELAYACSNITRCYDVAFCEHCIDCSASRFLSDCIGCRDCICCVGLRNAEYCVENQQLSRDEYEQTLAQLGLESHARCDSWLARLESLKGANPRTEFVDRCEDSTGNYLVGCASARNSYLAYDCVDIESCVGVSTLSSSFFAVGHGSRSELLYSCEVVGDQAYDVRFSVSCQNSVQNLEYCLNVSNGSAHCFGCVGLRRGSYSILNRQYSKADYQEFTDRIRTQMRVQGEYGQFFPRRISPYAFNSSEASDFLPLSEPEARRRGFRWDPDEPTTNGSAPQIPDRLSEFTDHDLTQSFCCAASKRPFRVQAQELNFHRRMGIALSPYAPLERLARRGRFLRLAD